MTNAGATNGLEIFGPGKHISSDGRPFEFSAADVAAIASSYDPALHEAPLVIGHPKNDDPAFGWVAGLAVNKDGKLEAKPHQVDEAFATDVRKGKYKKMSASLYAPDAPGNPKPGAYYLRHVGFLGAMPPAVKGLRSASFAEGEQGVIEFSAWNEKRIVQAFRRIREFIVEKFSPDDADRILPAFDLESMENEATRELVAEMPAAFTEATTTQTQDPTATDPTQGEDMTTAAKETELKTKQEALDARHAELDARDAELKKRELEASKLQHAAFAESIVKKGIVLPRDKAALVEFLAALPSGIELEFAEGDETVKKPSAEWFKGFLEALPPQVDFSEHAPAGSEDVKAADKSALAIARKAQAHVAQQAKLGLVVSVADAVAHVSGV
jgi:hypothetical protein